MQNVFGERLKRLRRELGISQQTVADRIEMDVANYRKIERGRIQQPTEETERRLAEGLGLSFDDFQSRMSDQDNGGSAIEEKIVAVLLRVMAAGTTTRSDKAADDAGLHEWAHDAMDAGIAEVAMRHEVGTIEPDQTGVHPRDVKELREHIRAMSDKERAALWTGLQVLIRDAAPK